MFKSGIKWIVRNYSNLTFWFDKWMSEGSIRNLIMGPLNKGEDSLLLKDIFHNNS